MKAYYGCEHQVLEYDSCCRNQRKFFYVDDLIKMLDERKKYLHAMVEKYKRNNLEDQYDAAAHEIETILKELE
jgi:protein associated with RNAse G/E